MNFRIMRKVQFGELIEFVAVAEYRSYTRAAVELGISTATLSESVRGVEARLGVRLLNRTTRRVAPTPAGAGLLKKMRAVIKELESALEELNEYRDRPAGCLRLAVAPAAADLMGPSLARFVKGYSDIRIEISTDCGPVDFATGCYDAGIQLGRHVPQSMVAVRVSPDIQHVVVGAPSYFERHPPPQTPQELCGHDCIRLRSHAGKTDAWQFVRGEEEFSVVVDGAIVLDDVELALRMAASGGGLLYVPENCVRFAVSVGALQVVLQGWMPRPSEAYVLCYPSRRQNPATLRSLADFLRKDLHRQGHHVTSSLPPGSLCA